jgi:hypothetical protein
MVAGSGHSPMDDTTATMGHAGRLITRSATNGKQNPRFIQDLCSRYRVRLNRQASALRDAMVNEEEPTVVRQELGQELDFLRDCFNYQVR